ncbi:MAG: hypothetical protein VKL59_01870 [Nostocaceae cyanobacterium]|nr:hypothetical protein [Nostocaceae cyanobacterium]
MGFAPPASENSLLLTIARDKGWEELDEYLALIRARFWLVGNMRSPQECTGTGRAADN